MKFKSKILICVTAMSCLMAVPAMAAEGGEKAQYKSEIADVRAELKTVESQLKEIKSENKTLSAEFKTIRAGRKAEGSSATDKAEWKKTKTLMTEVKEIRTELRSSDGTAKVLRKSASETIKNKNFEEGVDYLTEALKIKKEKLELVTEVNELLTEIISVN